MGIWDTGPFGNDTAADLCGDLDGAAAEERPGMVRGVLLRAVGSVEYLEEPEAEEVDGVGRVPGRRLPDLVGERAFAADALDRVLAGGPEPGGLWDGSRGGPWRPPVPVPGGRFGLF
ncbi:DUF4259 domain-containing protein [Nocardiopsis sp. CC223A]|uniref:DUF4259 domain-containing protein n=1 Tax=Nocardiopsis sp. CC223A TaxID=3044051 RepID=UPI00278BB22D|nr:DUF4259 domain-containing protein [Nocardiopsis sp. CC223A]